MGDVQLLRTTVALVLFFTLAIQLFQSVETANIVFFLGVSTYSHRLVSWPLAESLVERGHNVTYVSPYPAKKPNPKIHDYIPRTLKEWVDSWGDGMPNVFELRKSGINSWTTTLDLGVALCTELYKDEEYIGWVKDSKVDLVFIDSIGNDCAYGMAHYWGAKIILFSTTSPFSHFVEAYGLPDDTDWIPRLELAYEAEGMSLSQRITNALIPLAWDYYRKWISFPELEELTKQKLGMGDGDLPSFEDIERNTSLLFLNTYYAEEFPRAVPPSVVNVGGIVCTDKRNRLPKELDEFLNKGNGFIYMSFGTYADFFKMEEQIQEAFIQAMKNFPHIQFVWKLQNDSLAREFPNNNVFVGNWLPQQDILAHPKIRAFITHAGLLGIQEAICNSVPLISFPIFADQDSNAERIHRKEYGIRLEVTTVTQHELEDAINSILTDPKYRNNMKSLSTLFKERPQTPLETALWWTEFVLRHSHEELAALRPLNVGHSWWTRRQLDVWATIVASALALLLSSIYVTNKLLKFAFNTNAASPDAVKFYKGDRKKTQ